MTKRKSRPAGPTPLVVRTGDDVLMGGTYASMPGHWYFASVLWAEGEDILLRRSNQNGDRWIQESSIYSVRAVGTMAELIAIKETARKAIAELTARVDEAESELGRARGAVHAKLEELAKGGLKIAPFDRVADIAHQTRVRAAIESYDEQEARESAS